MVVDRRESVFWLMAFVWVLTFCVATEKPGRRI